MIVKPIPAPADPNKVCKTCGLYDPDVHVCCANDTFIFTDVAQTKSCSDWEPKHICITCGRFDPATNGCWWFGEQDMSEESMTKPCESWEPKKDKQPVFGGTSLKELEEKHKGLEKKLHIESDMSEIPKDTRKALSEFMSNDGSIVRARMLESLDIVFGLAIQQAPTLRERWIRLREQCIGALQMRWKQEDEKKESKP